MRRRTEIYKVAKQQLSIWGTVIQRGEQMDQWLPALSAGGIIWCSFSSTSCPGGVPSSTTSLPPPPPSLRVVWLTEWRADIIRSPVKHDVSKAPILSHIWQTSGLSPSEVHGDKSHGELDTETQILIDHGGCAFPKRFIKHCCLHLTHDSSLTKQMPPLSILFLWSLQSNRLLCWHIPPPTEIFVMWGCSALHHMKGKTYSELIKVYI